ncbi:MAG: hypothetical protein Q8P26_00860, partial [Candidatus Levybacteria bacterium]|nr:hypothetical protein [Candidatus Levybacteria bacterium]
VLTACGKDKDKEYSPTPTPMPTATLTKEPTPTLVGLTPTTAPTTEPTPTLTATTTPESQTPQPVILSINAKPGYEIVREPDGRIWMPNIEKIPGGNEIYATVLRVPDAEQHLKRTVNAKNAVIYEDTNNNSIADNQDVAMVIAANGQEVTLKRGRQYIIKGGAKDGGVSFELFVEPTPTATPTKEPTPTLKPTATPEASKGPVILSINAQKGYEIVIEPDGRIWMPNIEKVPGGNEAYSIIFRTPNLRENLDRTLNAINARLYEDTNRDGNIGEGDIFLGGNVNGSRVILKPNTQYILNGGSFNGGAELAVNK